MTNEQWKFFIVPTPDVYRAPVFKAFDFQVSCRGLGKGQVNTCGNVLGLMQLKERE